MDIAFIDSICNLIKKKQKTKKTQKKHLLLVVQQYDSWSPCDHLVHDPETDKKSEEDREHTALFYERSVADVSTQHVQIKVKSGSCAETDILKAYMWGFNLLVAHQ